MTEIRELVDTICMYREAIAGLLREQQENEQEARHIDRNLRVYKVRRDAAFDKLLEKVKGLC